MNDPGAVHRLRAVPLLAGSDEATLVRIAAVATEFDVPAGHVLVEHGQPGAGMFLLMEGTVTVELPHATVELGAGDFVGELALLAEGVTRTARVRATTRVRGLAIGRQAFRELLEEDPRIAVAMLPVLARRLADAEAG